MRCARSCSTSSSYNFTVTWAFILFFVGFRVGNEPIISRKQWCLRLVVSSLYFSLSFIYIIYKNWYFIWSAAVRTFVVNVCLRICGCVLWKWYVFTDFLWAPHWRREMCFDFGCTKWCIIRICFCRHSIGFDYDTVEEFSVYLQREWVHEYIHRFKCVFFRLVPGLTVTLASIVFW